MVWNIEGSQRERRWRDLEDTSDPKAANQGRPAASWLCVAEKMTVRRPAQWIYSGSFTEAGNQTARRDPIGSFGSGFASGMGAVLACESPRPLQSRRRATWDGKSPGIQRENKSGGNADQQKIGLATNVPDFKVDSKPKDHMGPFIMNPEGRRANLLVRSRPLPMDRSQKILRTD